MSEYTDSPLKQGPSAATSGPLPTPGPVTSHSYDSPRGMQTHLSSERAGTSNHQSSMSSQLTTQFSKSLSQPLQYHTPVRQPTDLGLDNTAHRSTPNAVTLYWCPFSSSSSVHISSPCNPKGPTSAFDYTPSSYIQAPVHLQPPASALQISMYPDIVLQPTLLLPSSIQHMHAPLNATVRATATPHWAKRASIPNIRFLILSRMWTFLMHILSFVHIHHIWSNMNPVRNMKTKYCIGIQATFKMLSCMCSIYALGHIWSQYFFRILIKSMAFLDVSYIDCMFPSKPYLDPGTARKHRQFPMHI